MTVLTSILNGASLHDVRDTLNAILSDVANLKVATAPLPKIAAGFARVAAGQGRCVIACVGDSVTDGAYPPSSTRSRTESWPYQTAALLTSMGIPARSDTYCGGIQDGTTITDLLNTYAGQLTLDSTWAVTGPTANASFGGGFLHGMVGGVGTFTPLFSADRFDFFVTGAAGLGTIQVSDASGQLASINETVQPPGYRRVTVSRATASLNPITFTVGTAEVYINAIVPSSSTQPRVELLNLGWPGAKVSDWQRTKNSGGTTFDWLPGNALGIFKGLADGFFLELGINDSNAGVTAATYQSGLIALAGQLAGAGDVLLVKPHPAGGNGISTDYLAAIDAAQQSLGRPISPVNFNSLSLTSSDYFDGVHLTASGYAKEAAAVLAGLKLATGRQ